MLENFKSSKCRTWACFCIGTLSIKFANLGKFIFLIQWLIQKEFHSIMVLRRSRSSPFFPKKKSSVLESESITLLYDQMLQMRDPNCAKSEMKCYLEVNQMMIKNDFSRRRNIFKSSGDNNSMT